MDAPRHDLPAPPPPTRRRRWATLALCALIFLGGGVVGAGIAAVHLAREARDAYQHPELAPKRLAGHLRRKLDLDDAQTARVEAIVTAHQERLLDVRAGFLEAALPEFDALEQEITEVLSPDQASSFERQVHAFREDWLPRFDARRRARWKERREDGPPGGRRWEHERPRDGADAGEPNAEAGAVPADTPPAPQESPPVAPGGP